MYSCDDLMTIYGHLSSLTSIPSLLHELRRQRQVIPWVCNIPSSVHKVFLNSSTVIWSLSTKDWSPVTPFSILYERLTSLQNGYTIILKLFRRYFNESSSLSARHFCQSAWITSLSTWPASLLQDFTFRSYPFLPIDSREPKHQTQLRAQRISQAILEYIHWVYYCICYNRACGNLSEWK